MKILIRYDEKLSCLEVPEEDFTLMIEADYEDRLSSAEDKEVVVHRSAQEIINERFNKLEYNNWHQFDRHRGMPKKPFHKDDQEIDETDHMDYLPDTSVEETWEKQAEYDYVCDMIRKTLKPNQAELIIAIYLDGISVTKYAEREGVHKSAISHRLETAKRNFKKVFPKSSTFPSCQG